MTLAIPQQLYITIQKHKEIRWTEVARQALLQKAKQLESMDPWREYTIRHALEDWDATDELFRT